MTTRPALYRYRDHDVVPTYVPEHPHPVPIPAADVVEAVRVLRRALDHFGDLDTDLLEGVYSAYGPAAQALHDLYRATYEWDQQTAHVPFQAVEHLARTLLDLSAWQYDGCEVPPGRYQEIAGEVALAHRLLLALDAYDLATYAVDDAESAAEAPAQETATPEPALDAADVVEAFYALSQALKAKGVNVERVARDAVVNMTPEPALTPAP